MWPGRPIEPTVYELEVWRAAAKLDTREAYEAYLKRFPNGAFAEMARMSIAKQPSAVQATAPSARSDQPVNLSELNRVRVEPESGALTLKIGDNLIGPGVVAVGWFGAKRQVVVPRGAWTMLAAFDHPLRSATVTVQLTTVAMGNFDTGGLRSLLVATMNSRTIPPPTATRVAIPPELYYSLVPRWPASEACERSEAGDALFSLDASYKLRTCTLVRHVAGRADPLSFATGLSERVDAVLERVKVKRPDFVLRSDLHFTEPNQAYMGYVRFDAAPYGLSDTNQAVWIAARTSWLRAFSPTAEKAYFRKIDADDLASGAPAASLAFDLPI